MLRHRLLTALLGIPLGLAVIYLGGWYLTAVVAVIAVVGMHEFYRMKSVSNSAIALLGHWFALGVIAGGVPLGHPYAAPLSIFGPLLLLVFTFVLQPAWRAIGLRTPARDMLVMLAGVVYIPLLLAFAVRLRFLDPGRTLSALPAGALWLFLVVGATWAMDIAAYAVGKAIGRHKLCPAISPGKTVEGAVGAVAGALAVVWPLGTWLGLSGAQAVLLGMLLGRRSTRRPVRVLPQAPRGGEGLRRVTAGSRRRAGSLRQPAVQRAARVLLLARGPRLIHPPRLNRSIRYTGSQTSRIFCCTAAMSYFTRLITIVRASVSHRP
jgi:phosphatidate cytidylyltransferase